MMVEGHRQSDNGEQSIQSGFLARVSVNAQMSIFTYENNVQNVQMYLCYRRKQ